MVTTIPVEVAWGVLLVVVGAIVSLGWKIINYIRANDADKQSFNLALKDRDLRIKELELLIQKSESSSTHAFLQLEKSMRIQELEIKYLKEKQITSDSDSKTFVKELNETFEKFRESISDLSSEFAQHRAFHEGRDFEKSKG